MANFVSETKHRFINSPPNACGSQECVGRKRSCAKPGGNWYNWLEPVQQIGLPRVVELQLTSSSPRTRLRPLLRRHEDAPVRHACRACRGQQHEGRHVLLHALQRGGQQRRSEREELEAHGQHRGQEAFRAPHARQTGASGSQPQISPRGRGGGIAWGLWTHMRCRCLLGSLRGWAVGAGRQRVRTRVLFGSTAPRVSSTAMKLRGPWDPP